ncbi:MAG: hypothetical protein Q3985_06650 [Eubacteriales bacterium]|nr:hypothetical protein [Eubacteriales bacterium]
MIEQNKNFVQFDGGEFVIYCILGESAMPHMTVTNGRQTVMIPFEDGEMTAVSLQRVLHFLTPCHGHGTCGRCKINVILPDGTRSAQLACMYPAREMTIEMPVIRLKVD